MAKMLDIKVSPQTSIVLINALTDRITQRFTEIDPLNDFDSIAELIAELRSLQKLMIAYNHHYAECDCCK